MDNDVLVNKTQIISTHSEEEVMTYSVELSGLRDNTTYYVQVLATNTAQRYSKSCVHTFTTLPLQVCNEGGI